MHRTTRYGILLALSLAATARGADAPQSELDSFQGTWTMVSFERGGKAQPSEGLKGRVVVIEGKTWMDRKAERVYGQGVLKIDPFQSPKAVDVTYTAGSSKGKTSPGIYDLNGETLKVCMTDPGDDRPTAFLAKPGTMLMLVVLKRQK